MSNILVTGSNGQLGSEIRVIAKDYPQFNFVFTDVAELDLTSFKAVEETFQNGNFRACINCAAYTAVDKAEDDQELSMLINFTAVDNLAKVCKSHNALLIHVSTDYVFSGLHYKPYEETDPVSPDSYYGLTKLKGEESVLDICDKAVILRTSWLYSSFGNNFVKTMIRLGKERDELGVVVDQVGTPTYAADLAQAIISIIIKNGNENISQVYHYSNEGVISWYDFAKAIMRCNNINCNEMQSSPKTFLQRPTDRFIVFLIKLRLRIILT